MRGDLTTPDRNWKRSYGGRHAAFVVTIIAALAAFACSPAADETISQPINTVSVEPTTSTGQEIFASNEDGSLPAPPLNGDGHTWHHGDGLLYRIVSEGGGFLEVPGFPNFKSKMPAFGAQLGHDGVVAVITYIKTFWTGKTSQGLSIVESQALVSENDPFPPGGE